MSEIQDEVRWYSLFRRRTELEIKRIFDAYREMGIEPVLIKGWAAARNYPDTHPRFYGDIDLAVHSDQADECLERNRNDRLTTLNIDVHRELRHLDNAPWDELLARSDLVEIEGTAVRILAPEDHLRVLCTHWLNDGGQYKERLWDIYYAVENRPKDFDWDLCLKSVSDIRQNWIKTTIAITKRHLGLVTNDLPFHSELNSYPAWIDQCLAKEWSSDVRIRSLDTLLNEPKMFLKQLLKRFPPNPIQAMIEAEAPFDERSRLPKQIKSITLRLGPSVSRLTRASSKKLWAKIRRRS